MIIYALIAEGYSDSVGYVNGRGVHWSRTTFATDEAIIERLKEEGKATAVPHLGAPFLIEDLGDMLRKERIDFTVYQIRLTDQEARTLNANYNKVRYA